MSDNKPGNPRRANALEDTERMIVTYLRAQHLPGVDTDDEAGVALEIEQGELARISWHSMCTLGSICYRTACHVLWTHDNRRSGTSSTIT